MWCSGKESVCQCRRCKRVGFNPRVRKTPWSRKWQPTPVFLPGKIPWREELGRLQSMGSQSDGHNYMTEHTHTSVKVRLNFFFFLHIDIQLFQHYLLKRCFLLSIAFEPLQTSIDHICVNLFLISLCCLTALLCASSPVLHYLDFYSCIVSLRII